MESLWNCFCRQNIQNYIYDALKLAHERMLSLYPEKSNIEHYAWRTGEKEVNLIGVRGFRKGLSRPKNLQNQWDDTLFVARIVNGLKVVDEFVFNVDYATGNAAELMDGCYKFKLSRHKNSLEPGRVYVKLSATESQLSGHKISYRALHGKEALYFRDYNQSLIQEPWETGVDARTNLANESHSAYIGRDSSEDDVGINIHFGGDGSKIGANSEGCQVVRGWEAFKSFMEIIETDSTLRGRYTQPRRSIQDDDPNDPGSNVIHNNSLVRRRNELVEPLIEGTEGARDVTYTLIEGRSLEHFLQLASCFPVGENGVFSPFGITSIENADIMNQIHARNQKGAYPVAGNLKWHSGIHLHPAAGQKIIAPMLGRIVAARLAVKQAKTNLLSNGSYTDQIFGSSNFVITEHWLNGKKCFCLFLHLADAFENKVREKTTGNFLRSTTTITHEQKTPNWINQLFKKYRVKRTLHSYGPETTFGINGVALANGRIDIPRGSYIFKCDRLPNRYPEKEAPENFIWIASTETPGGAWVNFNEDDLEEVDVIRNLKDGEIVSLMHPVLPGDFISYPGDMLGEEGVHFEVFSEIHLFEDAMRSSAALAQVEMLAPQDISGMSNEYRGFRIVSMNPGSPVAQIGSDSVFQVKSCVNATQNQVNAISWRVQVFNESGRMSSGELGPIFEEVHNAVGPTLRVKILDEWNWMLIRATAYTDVPHPSQVIERYVIPGEIKTVAPESFLIPPEGVAKHWLPIVGKYLSEEGETVVCEDSSRSEKSKVYCDSIPKSGKKRVGFLDGVQHLVMKVKPEWFGGAEDKVNEAKANGYRLTGEQVTPYLWWKDAQDAKVALPNTQEVFHYHPVFFLQSLRLVASPFWSGNRLPLLVSEMDYSPTKVPLISPATGQPVLNANGNVVKVDSYVVTDNSTNQVWTMDHNNAPSLR